MVLKGGISTTEAEQALKGTVSSYKNEILFSRFGINYNNEPEMFRKGTVIYRAFDHETVVQNGEEDAGDSSAKMPDPTSKTQIEKARKRARGVRVPQR